MRYVARDFSKITGNQEIERAFLLQDAVHIRNAEIKDLNGIIKIADAEFGKHYFDEISLKEQICSPSSVFRVAENVKNEIVGFSYAYLTTAEEIKEKIGIASLPPEIEKSSKIALRKSMAVKSSYQRKGIGAVLLNDALMLFKEQQMEAVLSITWKSKKGINIAGLMQFYAFKQYKEIPNFWTADSIQKGYLCPECGNPCKCSAVIYTKVL
jgi:N-acetylglutamate synthase-like GNAT family acetyltransferase